MKLKTTQALISLAQAAGASSVTMCAPHLFDCAGFDVDEDPHLVVLTCRQCGAKLKFTANADPNQVESAIAEHKEDQECFF